MSLKTNLRQLKDFLFPGRKRRREYLAKLSQQITNLELELAASRVGSEEQTRSLFTNIETKSAELSQRLSLLDPALESIHRILEQHDTQLSASVSQSQTLESRVSGEMQRIDSLQLQQTDITGLVNLNAQKQSELKAELKNELLEEIEQGSVANLNGQIREFEQRFSSIVAKLDWLEKSTLEANSSREYHQNEIALLHKYVESIGIALQSVGQRISNLKSQLEGQLGSVSQSIESLALNSRKFASEKDEYSNRLSELGGLIETCIQQFNNRMANLLDGFSQVVQADQALTNRSNDNGGIIKFSEAPGYRNSPKFCDESFALYSRELNDSGLPFIYLDLKSIPRSGLHYFQRTLATLLDQKMSFCEWYNEPGCCQKMPCALTGFANRKNGFAATNLRMVKSHDFDLDDPTFPTSEVIQRRILIRDPLFSLTSWWSLDVLTRNAELLHRHGISLTKINYLHESAVLNSAYSIIDDEGEIPAADELVHWLETKSAYSLGFIRKWGVGSERDNVVFYKNVNRAIEQLATQLLPYLPADAKDRIENWCGRKSDGFKSRTNPFSSSSRKIGEFLDRHSGMFLDTADEIVRSDSTNLFRESLEPSALARTIA